MAMRKSTRQELRKLREILRFLLRGKCCFFCKRKLISAKSYAKDGDGQGSPISRQLTIHHVNGNHSDDRRENKRLTHQRCHRSYEKRKWWREARG